MRDRLARTENFGGAIRPDRMRCTRFGYLFLSERLRACLIGFVALCAGQAVLTMSVGAADDAAFKQAAGMEAKARLFLDAYDRGDAEERILLELSASMLVRGMDRLTAFYQDHDQQFRLSYCRDDPLPLTGVQVIQMIRNEVALKPAYRDIAYRMVIYASLARTYPCKPPAARTGR